MHPLAAAMLLNSALYLAGVFVAGMAWHDRDAVICAMLAAALCYLAPLCQAWFPDMKIANTAIVILTIIAGAAAGVLLIT